MDPRDEALLIEAAASPYRPRTARDLPIHPAWYDLDPQGRLAAFEAARTSRVMEAALDPDGMSTTVRAVLDRIERSRGPDPWPPGESSR